LKANAVSVALAAIILLSLVIPLSVLWITLNMKIMNAMNNIQTEFIKNIEKILNDVMVHALLENGSLKLLIGSRNGVKVSKIIVYNLTDNNVKVIELNGDAKVYDKITIADTFNAGKLDIILIDDKGFIYRYDPRFDPSLKNNPYNVDPYLDPKDFIKPTAKENELGGINELKTYLMNVLGVYYYDLLGRNITYYNKMNINLGIDIYGLVDIYPYTATSDPKDFCGKLYLRINVTDYWGNNTLIERVLNIVWPRYTAHISEFLHKKLIYSDDYIEIYVEISHFEVYAGWVLTTRFDTYIEISMKIYIVPRKNNILILIPSDYVIKNCFRYVDESPNVVIRTLASGTSCNGTLLDSNTYMWNNEVAYFSIYYKAGIEKLTSLYRIKYYVEEVPDKLILRFIIVAYE